jgi:hypothetical protein
MCAQQLLLHWWVLQVCWFLLEAGYDPDDVDPSGNTSLHLGTSPVGDVPTSFLVNPSLM